MRQKVLLGILVVLVLIVAWVYLVPGDEGAAPSRGAARAPGGMGAEGEPGAPPPRLAAGAAVPAASGKETAETVVALRLDALDVTRPGFTAGRDPWRFVEPPPPPPPKPKPPTAAQLKAMQEAEEARRRLAEEQARLAAIEAAKPKPPPFTLGYLGSFGPPGRRIAVFTDGQKVWNAHEGDTLDGKFIVAKIGYESVDIRFVYPPDWPAERVAIKH